MGSYPKKSPQPDPKKAPRPIVDLATFFAGLAPILKPEQRDKLSEKLAGNVEPRGPSRRGGGHRDHDVEEGEDLE